MDAPLHPTPSKLTLQENVPPVPTSMAIFALVALQVPIPPHPMPRDALSALQELTTPSPTPLLATLAEPTLTPVVQLVPVPYVPLAHTASQVLAHAMLAQLELIALPVLPTALIALLVLIVARKDPPARHAPLVPTLMPEPTLA